MDSWEEVIKPGSANKSKKKKKKNEMLMNSEEEGTPKELEDELFFSLEEKFDVKFTTGKHFESFLFY